LQASRAAPRVDLVEQVGVGPTGGEDPEAAPWTTNRGDVLDGHQLKWRVHCHTSPTVTSRPMLSVCAHDLGTTHHLHAVMSAVRRPAKAKRVVSACRQEQALLERVLAAPADRVALRSSGAWLSPPREPAEPLLDATADHAVMDDLCGLHAGLRLGDLDHLAGDAGSQRT